MFTCSTYDHYIYGKRITVETDHKPLVTIKNKPLHSTPTTRLQKMLMKLHRYNIDLVYKSGQELHIPDALSHAYLPETEEEDDDFEVMSIMPVSPNRTQRLMEETQRDQKCKVLIDLITNGWPNSSQELSQQIKRYFAFRDELVIQDGLIMKGQRILIPNSLKMEYMYPEELHKGHPGAETMKRRTRETVYWFEITQDIDTFTPKCEKCNELKPHLQKEPSTWNTCTRTPLDHYSHRYLLNWRCVFPSISRQLLWMVWNW